MIKNVDEFSVVQLTVLDTRINKPIYGIKEAHSDWIRRFHLYSDGYRVRRELDFRDFIFLYFREFRHVLMVLCLSGTSDTKPPNHRERSNSVEILWAIDDFLQFNN